MTTDIPPEPARDNTGFVGHWVMTKEQFDRLPNEAHNRWVWETMRCRDGVVRSFSKPRTPIDY